MYERAYWPRGLRVLGRAGAVHPLLHSLRLRMPPPLDYTGLYCICALDYCARGTSKILPCTLYGFEDTS